MVKRPGIGYKHYDGLTIDTQPTYKPLAEVPEGANATWTLLCCIALIEFLKEHVAGDGVKYKLKVINQATDYLNERIIYGGLKKPAGVKAKIKEVCHKTAALGSGAN
jgi:hypothetical protein